MKYIILALIAIVVLGAIGLFFKDVFFGKKPSGTVWPGGGSGGGSGDGDQQRKKQQ